MVALIRIDESHIQDHCYLSPEDECYYFGEYISRGGYSASEVNQLILNFKKPVDRIGTSQYAYKLREIERVGRLVSEILSVEILERFTFVPVPPSKSRDHPLYDDRLIQSLRRAHPDLDVRELILSSCSDRSHHEYGTEERRPTPEQLENRYIINEAELQSQVKPGIVIFDDILTTGAHFKACKSFLGRSLPGTLIIGLFIGRANH